MTKLLDPVDLRALGFSALVKDLGWVNAVRFLHQYEKSTLNYTEERRTLLPELDNDELLRLIAEQGQPDAS